MAVCYCCNGDKDIPDEDDNGNPVGSTPCPVCQGRGAL